MSAPTIGSLCSGYGGLDMAVEQFFSAETAWFAEFEAAPSRVLEAHWSGVPNLGDMTAIDWSSVPKVDIITGGTPCQDLSAAGRRRGMTEGTRSNLWVQMRECIAAVRPSVVIWENVRGAYSAHATSEVELEQGLLGESYGPGRPALRALHRVLGDLADLGFDAEWVGVRAADAGAPHGRFRVFVVAYAQGDAGRVGHRDDVPVRGGALGRAPHARANRAADADRDGLGSVGRLESVGRDAHRRGGADGTRPAGEPAASAEDADVAARGERRLAAPGEAEGGRARADARGRGRASTANTERGRRQTTYADDAGASGPGGSEEGREPESGRPSVDAGDGGPGHHERRNPISWGAYEPAIRRWERVLGRVAPAPTNPDGKGGAHRLSPAFVEWMMGLPTGHVTDPTIGLTRNEQLKALGNGVVPQQALLALSVAWPRVVEAVAA